MGADTSLYLKIAVGIFAMVPPPIIIPLFMGVSGGKSAAEKRMIAIVGALTFGVTMIVFTWFGVTILSMFGITLGAFRLAGGFMLLLIAVDMMRSDPFDENNLSDSSASSAALGIVPLGIPILAGPGAVAAVVIFAGQAAGAPHYAAVTAIIVAVTVYIAVTLLIVSVTDKLIGQRVTLVFNKVMGMIILAIAFEFMMDGLAAHFPEFITIHDATG